MGKGSESTNKRVSHLLTDVLARISNSCDARPDLILAAWPKVIGERLSPMTQALSFKEGILTVRVKNSTLYSLLRQYEKTRLLKSLREKFPTVEIRNIIFRMG